MQRALGKLGFERLVSQGLLPTAGLPDPSLSGEGLLKMVRGSSDSCRGQESSGGLRRDRPCGPGGIGRAVPAARLSGGPEGPNGKRSRPVPEKIACGAQSATRVARSKMVAIRFA